MTGHIQASRKRGISVRRWPKRVVARSTALRWKRSMTQFEPTQQESIEQTNEHRSGITELHECPVCGAIGLAERILEHDCEAFLEHKIGVDH